MLGPPRGDARPTTAPDLSSAVKYVEALARYGARVVSLRRGENGSLIYDAATNKMVRLPAFPGTNVVDVTGCGNAFCGAFLKKYEATGSVVEGALWGTAAASIMVRLSALSFQCLTLRADPLLFFP
jgi:sugar/nucleoside kinase (ribokinase family)